jgi:RNA polymerase sigma factor (sigma-70 family)
MGVARTTLLPENVRRTAGAPGLASVPDRELLERFLKSRDEAAFELLLWRHGALVLNVCMRVLQDTHLAEDVFQLTFLTLARRAGTIARAESVGSWLYKVAYRTALRARTRAGTVAALDRSETEPALPGKECDPAEAAAWSELRPILDAEVNRLPEHYRSAFILCYLQGKTNEEAAQELGCPKGTVDSRLARARERLRDRLGRRGISLAMLPFTVTLMHYASEAPLTAECVTAALRRTLDAVATATASSWFAAGRTLRRVFLIGLLTLTAIFAAGFGYSMMSPGGWSSTPGAGNGSCPTSSSTCGSHGACHPLADPDQP